MNAEDFHDTIPSSEQGRFPYLIEGKITNINDDAGLGRVKARIRGQDAHDESDWLAPAWPGAIEAIPNVDDMVWVVFIEGDPAHGVYWWFPTKNTQGRPTEFMALGTTTLGIINNLADQVQQLKTTVNNLITIFNVHVHAYSFGNTSPPPSPGIPDSDPAPAKGMASDGSVVSSVTLNKIALSGKLKLR